MSERSSIWVALGSGAIAGLFGGVLFGLIMRELGMLPTVASLIASDSVVIGFLVHMVISALVGAGFSWFIWYQEPGASETLYWGLAYGMFWWFVGPLTLMPLILVGQLTWSVDMAQAAIPSMFGHLIYGSGLAIALIWLRSDRQDQNAQLTIGGLLRGMIAAGLGALVVILVMPDYSFPVELALLMSLIAGIIYALFNPRLVDGSGVSLIRGYLFGFFAWITGELTLFPLLQGEKLSWSFEFIQGQFPDLIAYLLFGAILGWSYYVMSRLAAHLFSGMAHSTRSEGLGTRGLRVIVWGLLSGIVGGSLFFLVMWQTGSLPAVAALIGMRAEFTGFAVHMMISILVGISYGLLFKGRSYDVGSALGWGVSYGFFWWILGALTLMPIMLGVSPDWSAAAVTELISSLIGHVAFGAGLGIFFYLLELQHNPWWIPRTKAGAERIRFRQEQVLTSAPALWVLVIIIALCLPVLLGSGNTT